MSFTSKNVSRIYCKIELMVGNIMSDEIFLVKKRLSHLLQHRVHGTPHNVWWIPFRQKTIITLTALRVHGTEHDVWWISFSSKNVYRISCNIEFMVHPMMSDEFLFVKKTFLALTALRVHGRAHDALSLSFSSLHVSRIYCTFVFI